MDCTFNSVHNVINYLQLSGVSISQMKAFVQTISRYIFERSDHRIIPFTLIALIYSRFGLALKSNTTSLAIPIESMQCIHILHNTLRV
jgi:hypothetical protein